MQIDETYSPLLHRINQAIRWRAVHPSAPVPPAYEILTKYAHPPGDLLKLARKNLTDLTAAADVKKGYFSYRALFHSTLLTIHQYLPRKRAVREPAKTPYQAST